MDFKKITTYFKFSNQQRTGIFLLLLVIVILQLLYLYLDFGFPEKKYSERQEWLSLQTKVDSLKRVEKNGKPKMFLFNPNFITDYKGYKLGMSVLEIDRLLAFRKQNKYVNSAKEFQEVTKVSDSLLDTMSPFFKFPDWIDKKTDFKTDSKKSELKRSPKEEKIILLDINQATQEDLIKIYGIGDGLSVRILKEKEKFGAFVSMEQMNDVWGLSEEVISELKKHFKVISLPSIKKIPINDASLNDLIRFPYFRYALARQIITYRSMNGNIKNIEDLIKIKGFPVEKAKIIGLYLEY